VRRTVPTDPFIEAMDALIPPKTEFMAFPVCIGKEARAAERPGQSRHACQHVAL
jgi:hypothetical protein